MKTIVGYWSGMHVSQYEKKNGQWVEIRKNEVNGLKKSEGISFLCKKILIIGRDHILYYRKKYPKVNKEILDSAIQMDVPAIFPNEPMDYHYEVFEERKEAVFVHLWLWKTKIFKKIKDAFKPDYVIPEDLCFLSEDCKALFMPYGEKIYGIITQENKMITSAVFNELDDFLEMAEVFFSDANKKDCSIDNYIPELPIESFIEDISITHKELGNVPLCISNLLDRETEVVKRFQVNGASKLKLNLVNIIRLCLIGVITICLFHWIQLEKLSRINKSLSQEVSILSSRVQSVLKKKKDLEKLQVLFDSIQKEINQQPFVVDILISLTKYLPESSYLKRVKISNTEVSLQVVAKSASEVLKKLSGDPFLDEVQLRGTIRIIKGNMQYFEIISKVKRPGHENKK